ncbi:MAG: hypothetical protein K5653_07765 [Clostridiales bacterium]|nr:hypothetical protein [Clostridiales bacterium]
MLKRGEIRNEENTGYYAALVMVFAMAACRGEKVQEGSGLTDKIISEHNLSETELLRNLDDTKKEPLARLFDVFWI